MAAEHSLKSKVALRFEGIKLPNLDEHSKTDAFCVLYSLSGNKKTRLAETEVVADNLNPCWVKSIDVDYFFEQ